MSKLRRWLPLLAAIALAGALYAWQARQAGGRFWQGYAEGDDVFVGPTLPGELVHVDVVRGQQVAQGARLFEQDPTGARAALRQAQANLAAARATLSNLERPGGRSEQIAQAAADLADKTAVRERIARDLARDERLLETHAVPQQTVDTERQQLASATAQQEAAAAGLALLRAPSGRADQILAQRAEVVAAAAALQQARWQLAQTRVVAPAAGVVVDVVARAGEALTAGATVVDLLPAANLRVLFYVPEADLSSLRYGEALLVSCDGCGPGLAARISYIAPKPEYTPPVIYSQSSRGNLVYRIEASVVPADRQRLHPGQPLEVRPADGAATRP
ncbi:MAG: HlyD family efflux transporter periplasmic adaptor subunit [Rhodospirillales bacterium]|nr:HlyD family efflux transporter periplasmic adaptor subunit [Rhodospirillales bacterium]